MTNGGDITERLLLALLPFLCATVFRIPLQCVALILPPHQHSMRPTNSRPAAAASTREGAGVVADLSNDCKDSRFRLQKKGDAEEYDAQRTLYDVLKSSPDATREDLKRQYVALARQTHPDSLIGRTEVSDDSHIAAFNEIAAAWKILGNERERMRYDRKIKAKALQADIERMASELFDELALPLIRRTSVKELEASSRDSSSDEAQFDRCSAVDGSVNDLQKATGMDSAQGIGKMAAALETIEEEKNVETSKESSVSYSEWPAHKAGRISGKNAAAMGTHDPAVSAVRSDSLENEVRDYMQTVVSNEATAGAGLKYNNEAHSVADAADDGSASELHEVNPEAAELLRNVLLMKAQGGLTSARGLAEKVRALERKLSGSSFMSSKIDPPTDVSSRQILVSDHAQSASAMMHWPDRSDSDVTSAVPAGPTASSSATRRVVSYLDAVSEVCVEGTSQPDSLECRNAITSYLDSLDSTSTERRRPSEQETVGSSASVITSYLDDITREGGTAPSSATRKFAGLTRPGLVEKASRSNQAAIAGAASSYLEAISKSNEGDTLAKSSRNGVVASCIETLSSSSPGKSPQPDASGLL